MIFSDLFIPKTSVDGVGSQGQRREISSLSFKECFKTKHRIFVTRKKIERKREREGGRKETEVPVKKTVLVSVM